MVADMINAKRNQSKNITSLWLSVVFLFSITSLIGCDQQPKSMFEQQADNKAADKIVIASDDQSVLIKPDLSKDRISGETNKMAAIQVNKQQAIAHQRNCDPNKKPCQYFELNVLGFVPEQPWLSSIMWKTIAQILAPSTPLASQDQAAKNTILMLLKQIEYSEQAVNTSSLYQRIDTELVLNRVGTSNADAAIEASSKSEPMVTGYLLVRSTVKRGSSPHHLDYVMLDIQKKLQLTIEDILLPTVSTDSLLLAFQGAKEDWLISQGVAKDSVDDWSLPLSQQWYLDEQGLHLVYQSTELLEVDTEAADLLVPYSQLTALIKPAYIVQKHS